VVGMLPLVVGFVMFLMNPSYFQILTTHPTGKTLLGIGIGLELLGFAIIRWMTTPKVS
jgi:tight adherence protein B